MHGCERGRGKGCVGAAAQKQNIQKKKTVSPRRAKSTKTKSKQTTITTSRHGRRTFEG